MFSLHTVFVVILREKFIEWGYNHITYFVLALFLC